MLPPFKHYSPARKLKARFLTPQTTTMQSKHVLPFFSSNSARSCLFCMLARGAEDFARAKETKQARFAEKLGGFG